MRPTLLLIACSALLSTLHTSCQMQEREQDPTTTVAYMLNLDQTEEAMLPFTDMVARIELIQLSDKPLLGAIDKVVARNDKLYVLDKIGNQVVRYDRSGRFLGHIGKQGEGPGEYKAVYNMLLPPHSSEVWLLVPWHIQRYDSSGRYISQVRLAFHPSQIGIRGEEEVCYSTNFYDPTYYTYCQQLNPHQLEPQITDRFFPYTRAKDLSQLPGITNICGQFVQYYDQLYANLPGTPLIFRFAPQGPPEPFLLAEGPDIWPYDQREALEQFSQKMQQFEITYLNAYQIVDQQWGVFKVVRKGKRRSANYFYFFDTQRLYSSQKNFQADALRQAFLANGPRGYTKGGVFFILGESLKNNIERTFDELSPLVPEVIPEDVWHKIDERHNNPLVLALYLKDPKSNK